MKLKSLENYLKSYFLEVNKFNETYPDKSNFLQFVCFFPDWLLSLHPKRSPLTDERPWLTFTAIEFLGTKLRKDMTVYEYGVGGSTFFFANRVKKVISVEHEVNWVKTVEEKLRLSNKKNVTINLIVPVKDDSCVSQDPANPDSYVSNSQIFNGYSFKNYAESINKYPDQYFDLVMIDGRARPSCFKHSVNKVKDKGFLILDNAERDYYRYIHEYLENGNWFKYDFPGPGPYNNYFWKTCVWQKGNLGEEKI